jgi:hypothetical protein
VYETVAYTPAQLRAVLDAARRDPGVLAFPYIQRRELVGEKPARCRRGHLYARPGQPYPAVERGWLTCSCGGHVVYRCQVSHDGRPCYDEQIDPPLSYDCDTIWPQSPRPQGPAAGGPR